MSLAKASLCPPVSSRASERTGNIDLEGAFRWAAFPAPCAEHAWTGSARDHDDSAAQSRFCHGKPLNKDQQKIATTASQGKTAQDTVRQIQSALSMHTALPLESLQY